MGQALNLIASLLVMMSPLVLRAQQRPPVTEAAKAQAKPTTGAQAPARTKGEEPKKENEKVKTSSDEEPVVTKHRMHVDGKELRYTATAGLMPIKDAKGDVEARIFFIAYTLDEAGSAGSRPLMFSFNGGPGSASIWLHLGTLGPKQA